jgi:hypothetical protein
MIRNPPYVTEPEASISLDLSKDLDPSSKSLEPVTVIDAFRKTVRFHGSRPALLWKDGDNEVMTFIIEPPWLVLRFVPIGVFFKKL